MDVQTKILSVATDAFRQYGFKTITMDDIARKAGLSKKTLYQHFASKTDVVKAAVMWHREQVQGYLQNIMENSENAVEGLVKVNAVMIQIFRQINPLALLELERFFPDAYAVFRNKLIDKDIAAIRDNIIRGMEEGFYRPGLDADLLARYRVETCMIPFQPDSLLRDVENPHLVTITVMENFIFGILSAKGERLYNKYSEKYLKDTPRI